MKPLTRFHYESFPFPFYAVLVSLDGEVIQEDYCSPCSRDMLHRMFSITKSFTALAVTALAAEGKISLSDPIISYFPDYVPEDPHPWLSSMTIQDLLDMKTCHESTTYKIDPSQNWVRSFFVTPPDHRSGAIFKYDTSAAHTLAALVKRVSGQGILDYLRPVFLSGIGFSKQAYVLKDPFGDEIGGSGLLARPEDIMVTAQFLLSLYLGDFSSRYSFLFHDCYDEMFFTRYSALVKQCLSFRSPTVHEGKTLEECQGYGSQFWMIRNGFMMYGMGGQYAAVYPEERLIIVTAADTQSMQGGTQIILDEMYRIDSLLRNNPDTLIPYSLAHRPKLYNNNDALRNAVTSLSGTYRILSNPQGFKTCVISESAVSLITDAHAFRFPITFDQPSVTADPKYNQKLFVHTSALEDESLYQYAEIYDQYLGSIRILLHGDSDHLTIYLRKAEESLFSEFSGFLEAIKE
jgi:CubicO group peptidase (beta-lactamase class C family)